MAYNKYLEYKKLNIYSEFYTRKFFSGENESAEDVFKELQTLMKQYGYSKKEGEEYKDKEVYFDENDAQLLDLDWILNYYE